MTAKKQNELFPVNFIITGFVICCLLTISKLAVHNVKDFMAVFFGVMLVSVLCGYIPMKIAYERQPKHRRGIYILSVIAMSIASPFISIAAIVWACCDKKIDHTTAKNTQDKNTKRKTTAYDWQDWE